MNDAVALIQRLHTESNQNNAHMLACSGHIKATSGVLKSSRCALSIGDSTPSIFYQWSH